MLSFGLYFTGSDCHKRGFRSCEEFLVFLRRHVLFGGSCTRLQWCVPLVSVCSLWLTGWQFMRKAQKPHNLGRLFDHWREKCDETVLTGGSDCSFSLIRVYHFDLSALCAFVLFYFRLGSSQVSVPIQVAPLMFVIFKHLRSPVGWMWCRTFLLSPNLTEVQNHNGMGWVYLCLWRLDVVRRCKWCPAQHLFSHKHPAHAAPESRVRGLCPATGLQWLSPRCCWYKWGIWVPPPAPHTSQTERQHRVAPLKHGDGFSQGGALLWPLR